MNYELAKELQEKIVGIPELQPMDMRNGTWLPRDKNNNSLGLSELIEACGDKFISLEWIQSAVETWWWRASGVMSVGRGSTPEEAVARLWLTLNAPSRKPKTNSI